jgi:nucleoside-diphosphate-sugar epimerase
MATRDKKNSLVCCVTGAGGFVGSAVVKKLLEDDRVAEIRAVVRGDVNATRYDGLRGFGNMVKIFSADLVIPGSYDEAVQGCHVVIHLATPTTLRMPLWNKNKKLWDRVVRPAVEGVENIIGAIQKSGTVEKLVLTSSISAVQGDGWERGKEYVYTEKDFNVVDYDSPKYNAYACSKVRSEKRAWELFEAARQDSSSVWKSMIALCPGMVLGKPSIPIRNEFFDFMVDLLNGKVGPFMPNYHFTMVHLDDVVEAHVAAATTDACHGRYLLAQGGHTYGMTDVVIHLHKTYFQEYQFPHKSAPKWLLWVVSLFVVRVHWPLVQAYLDKPSLFDASRICQDVPSFMDQGYRDPIQGFAEMLQYIIDSKLVKVPCQQTGKEKNE